MSSLAITIDPEFRDLCPAITDEEEGLLTQSLDRDGLLTPLLIWKDGDKNILIDGHNRYRIIKKYGYEGKDDYPLTVTFQEVFCSSRKVALDFIISNQLARRNLTPAQRAELVQKRKEIRQGEAKERLEATQFAGKTKDNEPARRGSSAPPLMGEPKSDEPTKDKHAGETIVKLAAEAGMGAETLRRYGKIKEWGCDKETLDKLHQGKAKIGTVYREMMAARSGEAAPAKAKKFKCWPQFQGRVFSCFSNQIDAALSQVDPKWHGEVLDTIQAALDNRKRGEK